MFVGHLIFLLPCLSINNVLTTLLIKLWLKIIEDLCNISSVIFPSCMMGILFCSKIMFAKPQFAFHFSHSLIVQITLLHCSQLQKSPLTCWSLGIIWLPPALQLHLSLHQFWILQQLQFTSLVNTLGVLLSLFKDLSYDVTLLDIIDDGVVIMLMHIILCYRLPFAAFASSTYCMCYSGHQQRGSDNKLKYKQSVVMWLLPKTNSTAKRSNHGIFISSNIIVHNWDWLLGRSTTLERAMELQEWLIGDWGMKNYDIQQMQQHDQ